MCMKKFDAEKLFIPPANCVFGGYFVFMLSIHMIFFWAQIERSVIFGREIGGPDREIFSLQKMFKFNVKTCLFASP